MTVLEPRELTGRASGTPELPAHFVADHGAQTNHARVTNIAAAMLAVLSALTLWGFAYARVFGAVQEHRSQTVLRAELREQFAKQTSAIGGVIATRAPVALLRAPSIGMDKVVVVEGTSAGTLETGPGHRRDTVLPGQPGVSVVMGRSVLFGAPFRNIAALTRGTALTLQTGQGTFRYRVERVRRSGDRLPPRLADGASRLTLITSERHGATGRTVFVDALLKGQSQAPPSAHRVGRVRASEAAIRGDAGALAPLALWLIALAVSAASVAWLRPRWGKYQSLLVGVPALVACAWGVSQTAVRLLPNLL